jgi:hypothetical protein
MRLSIKPATLSQLNEAVSNLHRHHKPVQGHRFSLLVVDEREVIHGACSVGRPVAREVSQYETAEVTRLVTDGTKNACSILYAAAARACTAMGFNRIQTYILDSEPGTSVKAAGWRLDGLTNGGDWNHGTHKNRRTDQPQGPKQRWVKDLKQSVTVIETYEDI